jgi:hypothetical protein
MVYEVTATAPSGERLKDEFAGAWRAFVRGNALINGNHKDVEVTERNGDGKVENIYKQNLIIDIVRAAGKLHTNA